MNRTPILPTKTEPGWSETASSYRQSLHEYLIPKDQAWTPVTGSITSTSIVASYVVIGRLYSFVIDIQGATTSTAGYIDLPFPAAQTSVFNVAVSGLNKPAIINKGESRLYLPDWSGAGRAVVSGVVVS